jgi:hypothetical protein
MKSSSKYQLIAFCGMNCTLCMAYLRDKNRCPGCRTDQRQLFFGLATIIILV